MQLKIGNKSIHYEISGQSQPVLLVHGWGGSAKSLTKLGELLAKKYKVIAVDLPGFAKSDDPDPDWGVGEYAELLVNIIDKLKIRPVIYFGHSFGGALGIYIAVKYPAYIKKLILSGASYKRTEQSSSVVSKLLKGLPPGIKKLIYKIVYPQSDLFQVPQLESNFRKIISEDLTPLLSSVVSPTLILWGGKDTQTSVNLAQEAKLKIKNAKLKIYPEIGHSLPLKQPRLIFEEIVKFIP